MANYHNLSVEETIKRVSSSMRGLTNLEAQKRLNENGENCLKNKKKTNYFLKFLSQFKDIMVIILLISAGISLIFSLIKNSQTELIDAIIIFVIVLINATLGFTQELRAENALESLKKMAQPYAKVIRNGEEKRIKTNEIVVGDIVLLESGDVVPADLRLIKTASLKCDESALTGESLAVEKNEKTISKQNLSLGDKTNICFSSTVVVYGRGEGVVIATGHNAEIGKIASLLQEEKVESTPLQKSLNKLGEIITFIVLGIAIIIFLMNVIFAHHSYIDSFLTAVAIAVAAIPESLPAVVTIILSLGVTFLAKKNAIIKKLHAVETLGCCQVICSDKTGTITQNKMTVQEIFLPNEQPLKKLNPTNFSHSMLLKCMSLCNNSKNQNGNLIGEPTENALLTFAESMKISKQTYENFLPRISEIPFDSNRKLMSTLHKTKEGLIQFTKGGVDEILSRCNFIQIGEKVVEITPENKTKILNHNKLLCKKALRVLGFAYKKNDNIPLQTSSNNSANLNENNLIFLGLVGMIDPPRKEIFDALKKCKKAGMKTIMITGDHKQTATAIALKLNMIQDEKEVVNGEYLDQFSDKELVNEIKKYRVFTRVTPQHKMRIVKALKAGGKIVAMTGDGVNDAPSIKCADIGIGMGKTGTDVTKEVANMILADDNFATIVVAVEEGRKIFGNIQKTIQYLLSCNLAEVITMFLLTLFFPRFTLLTAVQILFINLVTDTLPSIALGMDNAEKDIMSLPPRDSKKGILNKEVCINILLQSIVQTLVIVAIYLCGIFAFSSPQKASTMAFLSINFIQLFHMYNMHSPKSIFKDSPFKNKLLNIAFLLESIVIVALSVIPTLSTFLGVTPLSLSEWLIVLLGSLIVIPACDLIKLLSKRTQK